MGGVLCSRQTPLRVIFQGLDAAGKTSLLYKLKLGEIVTTIPTIGFNVESISSNGLEITAWDLGGRDKVRPLYRHYYHNTNGFIYVVDSADTDRLDDALEELHDMILHYDEPHNWVVMVLANKQDLENTISPAEIEARLVKQCAQCKMGWSVSLFVMPCSVITGEGLQTAMDLFTAKFKDKKDGKLENGVITHAWELTNQKTDDCGDVFMENSSFSSGIFHKMKSSLFRDPFNLLKSALFY